MIEGDELSFFLKTIDDRPLPSRGIEAGLCLDVTIL